MITTDQRPSSDFEDFPAFLPHYAALLQPLETLLSSSKAATAPFDRAPDLQRAFIGVKEALAGVIILAHPALNAPLPLSCLIVDASDVAAGAVLRQLIEGVWTSIVVFFSKKFRVTEKRYSTLGRELPSAYLAIPNFQHFLHSKQRSWLPPHSKALS